MNYCSSNLTQDEIDLIESEKNPSVIRDDFGGFKGEYALVLDRSVPFTLSGLLDYNESTDTYTLLPSSWAVVTLSFHHDLDTSTGAIATADFPIVDSGQIDPDYTPGSGEKPAIDATERWSGVFPLSELNKLTAGKWVVAVLKGDDDDLISRCAFRVLGG